MDRWSGLVNVDVAALSAAERLAYIDVFDDVLDSLNRRAARLQASIAVAELRAQVHDIAEGRRP